MHFLFESAQNRRQFLKTSALTLAATAGGAPLLFGEDKPADPFAGFKVGLQSYSLRNFDAPKALEITKKLGLHYWESYPKHVPVSTLPKHISEQKEMLAGSEIKLLAYGVVRFDGNEEKAREIFDFAKAIGLESLSADPKKDEATFKLLDKLVDEYKVNIAIHNHGPKASYDKIDDVVNAIKDHHERIGACVDTGHYLRSRENPVEALERLKGRVYGVHLKDVKDATIFKILGEGDLDLVGCMKVLSQQQYKYCAAIEYEENPMNPVPDLEVCLQNLRKAIQQIGK